MFRLARRSCVLAFVAAIALVTPTLALADGFIIEPEAVFLQFRESDVDFARETGDGYEARLEADYEAGWRMGMGFSWGDVWDFRARFTDIQTEESGALSAANSVGGSFEALLIPDDDDFGGDGLDVDRTMFDDASAIMDVDMQWADIEIGRRFEEPDGHWARYFVGVRGAWLDQDVFALYSVPSMAYRTHTCLDWEAIGLRAGAEGHLSMGESGWTFWGEGSAAVMAGTNDTIAKVETIDDKGTTLVFHERDSFNDTSLVWEARLGFAWAKELDTMTFALRFGYEISNWSDIVVQQNFLDADGERTESEGDFGLDGGFIRFSWMW